jgi:DNA-binding protein YbaB
VCSKNGDSIEVFFDAWTPDAKNFLDLVFQRVRQLEDGTLPGSGGLRMAFPGYVAIRFTQATEALLGMQRWGTTVSMEIASINACKGTGPLLRRVHQDALDYLGPIGPRASVHWGQKNTVDMKHVEDAFGAWVTGGRLAQWRSVLSELTRNGRDAVFSTEFSRHAGLEVVQPRAYALTAAPAVTCAGSLVSVNWDAENNPPGTQAVLLLTTQTPAAPTRTVGRPSSLRGSAMLEVPPGRHILTLRVSYELNGRTLWDHLTVQVRGIAPGEILPSSSFPPAGSSISWTVGGSTSIPGRRPSRPRWSSRPSACRPPFPGRGAPPARTGPISCSPARRSRSRCRTCRRCRAGRGASCRTTRAASDPRRRSPSSLAWAAPRREEAVVNGDLSPELLAAFAEPAFDPVAVEVGELVTLRMDGNYRVLEVALRRDHPADGPSTQRLEIALVEAFNEAVRQVMERNAERLAALMAADRERASTRKDPGGAQ